MWYFFGQGISAAVFGAFLFYSLGSLIARKFLRCNWYELFLFMAVTFFVAVFLEVSCAIFYFALFGKHLWEYHVWPIHQSFTSGIAFLSWPMYGFYLYFLRQVLREYNIVSTSAWKEGLWTGFDGPLLEILVNLFFLICFNTFFFYYIPGDIWHLTSLQVVPFYAVCGVILAYVLRFFQKKPKHWKYIVEPYCCGILFLFLGEFY